MIGYPEAILYPSPNFRQGRRAALSHVVLHTTEDHSLEGSLNTLTDPYRQLPNEATGELESARVSSHYLVDDTGIYQLVSDEDEAWTVGNFNRSTINIEVTGEADEPSTWSASTVRYLARLVAWLSSTYGIPLDYQAESINPDSATPTPPAEPRGFVSHGALEPRRRHDPGIWFPWTEVRSQARQIINGANPASVGGADLRPLIALLFIALGIAWSVSK